VRNHRVCGLYVCYCRKAITSDVAPSEFCRFSCFLFSHPCRLRRRVRRYHWTKRVRTRRWVKTRATRTIRSFLTIAGDGNEDRWRRVLLLLPPPLSSKTSQKLFSIPVTITAATDFHVRFERYEISRSGRTVYHPLGSRPASFRSIRSCRCTHALPAAVRITRARTILRTCCRTRGIGVCLYIYTMCTSPSNTVRWWPGGDSMESTSSAGNVTVVTGFALSSETDNDDRYARDDRRRTRIHSLVCIRPAATCSFSLRFPNAVYIYVRAGNETAHEPRRPILHFL